MKVLTIQRSLLEELIAFVENELFPKPAVCDSEAEILEIKKRRA
jgi:hypothetical protein